MAVIDTIVARLEAEDAGFSRGLANAAQKVTDLDKALTKASAAVNRFQSGWASQSDILRTMQSDAQRAGAALQTVAAPTQSFGRLDRVIRSVGRNITNVGFAAAGLPGSFGRIAGALTMLSGATKPLLGITAIFAGIAIGIAKARKELEQMTAAIERQRARLQSHMESLAAKGAGENPNDLRILHAARVDLVAAIAQFESSVHRQLGGKVSPEELAALKRLNDVNAAILQLTANLKGDSLQALREARFRLRHVGDSAEEVADAIARLRLVHQGYTADVAASIVANLRLADTLNTLAEVERRLGSPEAQLQASQRRIMEMSGRVRLRGADPFQIEPEVHTQAGLDLRRELEGTLGDDKFQERLKQLGVSLGRQLMFGLMEGVQSMQDILRSLFMAVLDFGIGSLLGSLFKLGGGGVGKLAEVTKVSPQVAGAGITPAVMQLPAMQPATSFFVARDPAFQQVYREAALVAASQGFRR